MLRALGRRRLGSGNSPPDAEKIKPQATLRTAKAYCPKFIGVRVNPISLNAQLGCERRGVNVTGRDAGLGFFEQRYDTAGDFLDRIGAELDVAIHQ